MKKCYIICGGPEPCMSAEISEGAFIICADSGYDKALQAGTKPDLILGDFDSLENPLPDNIETMRSPVHKDDTDTEPHSTEDMTTLRSSAPAAEEQTIP